jgi:hypothetical protein
MDGGPDSAPLERRLALALMAGNQQQDAIVILDCPFQRAVDGDPCPVETMAVQIKDAVRLDPARGQLAIPTPVQSRLLQSLGPPGDRSGGSGRRNPSLNLDWRSGGRPGSDDWSANRIARQGADGCRYPRP